MHYKLYRYHMTDEKRAEVGPDRHYDLFQGSIGKDDYGRYANYRGKRDTVLMHVRKVRSDFTGLIGRHSTEREITRYIEKEDETDVAVVADDDYPNTPFACFPRLHSIACVDSAPIHANSAMSRLNQILASRVGALFVVESVKEPLDLRKAIRNFDVTEVSFEVLPVNPHTGPLGRRLDESRALDHIQKIKGRVEGVPAKPLESPIGDL